LQHLLDNLAKAGRAPDVIKLNPLTHDDIVELVAETTKRDKKDAQGLAEILIRKTEGNPFFASEFLKNLHRESALMFDRKAGVWQWDLAKVSAAAASDNVVELMIKRIGSL